jgi:hypothetical protein
MVLSNELKDCDKGRTSVQLRVPRRGQRGKLTVGLDDFALSWGHIINPAGVNLMAGAE